MVNLADPEIVALLSDADFAVAEGDSVLVLVEDGSGPAPDVVEVWLDHVSDYHAEVHGGTSHQTSYRVTRR